MMYEKWFKYLTTTDVMTMLNDMNSAWEREWKNKSPPLSQINIKTSAFRYDLKNFFHLSISFATWNIIFFSFPFVCEQIYHRICRWTSSIWIKQIKGQSISISSFLSKSMFVFPFYDFKILNFYFIEIKRWIIFSVTFGEELNWNVVNLKRSQSVLSLNFL